MTEPTLRHCRGPALRRAVRAATANVELHVAELNALNVYPVPDGDTGINMIATLRAALAEVEAIPPGRATLSELAAAISFGALMGARGNSGVILSQVLRGMAESAAGKRQADGRDFAEALMAGTRTAYSAVARPVEGTILTVVREAAEAAEAAVERDEPLGLVLVAATEAARRAVERTPEQLEVLREAGVVDAGGQGFYRALEGVVRALGTDFVEFELVVSGLAPGEPAAGSAGGPDAVAAVAPEALLQLPVLPEAEEGGWGYETVFLLEGRDKLDPEAIRRRLEGIGESVLVAGDARMIKVHVHNERPDEVLALGLELGTLSQVAIANLDEQAREMRAAQDAASRMPVRTPTAAQGSSVGAVRTSPEARPLAVVAVAAGGGHAEIFRSFGVARIIAAPPTGNPSTGEILEAIREIDRDAVIVLPNDPNIILAAEQAARACPEKEVVVVPTRSAPEGYAALLAMDPTIVARSNLAPMLAAAREVQTLRVAKADRPARSGKRVIRPGQVIVLEPDEGVVAAGDEVVPTIAEAIEQLEPRYELLSLYLGEEATRGEAETIARLVGERRPGTEVEILPGGQPHYRYLISAE